MKGRWRGWQWFLATSLLLLWMLSACDTSNLNKAGKPPFNLFPQPTQNPTQPEDPELTVLWKVEGALCPPAGQNPYAAPEIHHADDYYTLTCLISAGHATTVRIDRYKNKSEANKTYEALASGHTRLNFHDLPSATWGEQIPDIPNSLHRILVWQSERWLFRIESFDDTPSLQAADPWDTSELVYKAAKSQGMIK